ncbi:uncharacterized protein G2W53_028925 [Senna tora]|uniref:Uncharacterized protein n=1 Tax=Senna tora TaxID=362788 RepID=A0A834WD91_9FABA|nr:uncharacterized protein G2W53_028925 [Senna tora]
MGGVSSHVYTHFNRKPHRISKDFKKHKFERVVAQVSQTNAFALYLGIRVDLMVEWDS